MPEIPFDPSLIETPAYVIDLERLESNLRVLAGVQKASGANILLALKSFAAWKTFPIVDAHLCGYAASGLFEARLASDFGKGSIHVYSPAFVPRDFNGIAALATHIVFNSLAEFHRYRERSQGRALGIRINPEHSEVTNPLYDPAAPHSRLGVTSENLPRSLPDGISGLHFHTLCESGPDSLVRTLAAVEKRFAAALGQISWINFGGGHHITRPGYDVDLLIQTIRSFRKRWPVDVWLEPGEAVALNAGYLVTSVLDVVQSAGYPTAILDISAAAHMPDVLEMPYRPPVFSSGLPGERTHAWRLGGNSCLAGDFMGEYSFDAPLHSGDRLVFEDMAHYTMVKNTLFNGVRLPSITLFDRKSGVLQVQREFGYENYRDRLC